ncbi:hypothetical protein B4113_0104 [Geobacillus sp. B4113_201601]|nr:hypothetical protein B4113_0104 [Geobacillus sp. B4113_201601]
MQYDGTEHGLQNMMNAVDGIVKSPPAGRRAFPFLFAVFSLSWL